MLARRGDATMMIAAAVIISGVVRCVGFVCKGWAELTCRDVDSEREPRRVKKKTAPIMIAWRTASAVAVVVFPSRTA